MNPVTLSHGTAAASLCCMCGCVISENPANMCVNCLRDNVDITIGIPRQLTIHSCRSCGRFLAPPWQTLALESKELMAMCLRKIPGLSKLKLVDAVWIWTEPHSMRLQIKLTLQKEVINGAILQQASIVTYTIRNQQCKSCEASFGAGQWHAVVQVRQRVSHKRTFFFLEQLLLKHNAHSECINIITFRDGMDFYFTDKNVAMRFIDFLSSHIPMRNKYSRKLVSADHKSNIGEFKHNFIVEVVPICKDDLVMLPKALAQSLSDISPLCLVKAIGSDIHVVDPLNGERHDISVEKYWRHEFQSKMTSRQLIRCVVLSLTPILAPTRPSSKQRGRDRRLRLCECVVAREKDFGVNDTQFTCISHLGHVLKEGDVVLAFDLTTASWVHDEEANSLRSTFPELVLVRKYYGDKGERKWMLQELDVDEKVQLTAKDQEGMEADYEDFMQELEADKEMRSHVKLYKKQTEGVSKGSKSSSSGSSSNVGGGVGASGGAPGSGKENTMDEDDDDDDADEEEVRLEELLDNLQLSTENVTVAGEGMEGERGGAGGGAGLRPGEAVLLTKEEAEAIPKIVLQTSGFDAADIDQSSFKF